MNYRFSHFQTKYIRRRGDNNLTERRKIKFFLTNNKSYAKTNRFLLTFRNSNSQTIYHLEIWFLVTCHSNLGIAWVCTWIFKILEFWCNQWTWMWHTLLCDPTDVSIWLNADPWWMSFDVNKNWHKLIELFDMISCVFIMQTQTISFFI